MSTSVKRKLDGEEMRQHSHEVDDNGLGFEYDDDESMGEEDETMQELSSGSELEIIEGPSEELPAVPATPGRVKLSSRKLLAIDLAQSSKKYGGNSGLIVRSQTSLILDSVACLTSVR